LLDQQTKHTELLGGAGKVIAETEPNPYLAQTILDLSWDNSRSEGYDIGRRVLRRIGNVAKLHKKRPEHASLAVLKAPDIPSLLIETGFISNPQEERLLASADYQSQLATAIFSGVRDYYGRSLPNAGGTFSVSAGILRKSLPAIKGALIIAHIVK
jgi:N-acetylmuramoyl-L-alanine amidase